MKQLFLKSFILLTLIAVPYSIFMYRVDPYALLSPNESNKILPYPPLYSYNYIKHFKKIDFGFLGSSAINYYPIEKYYTGDVSRYSMGIESSNITEHIAYGKVLASKNPKEITFFITFYALNPARGHQNYFNSFVVSSNSLVVDFVDQYFDKKAFDAALLFLKNSANKNYVWKKAFNENGTRTQHTYLNNPDYNPEQIFADYLSYMSIDPRYYASETFKDPKSIFKGIDEIRSFCSYLKSKGIRIKLATAAEHRFNIALIYHLGLGETYEEFRRQLASIQPFYDLNLDTAFTSSMENFWDTHHVRRGDLVMKALKDELYLVNSQNVDNSLNQLRPTLEEIEKLKQILIGYNKWESTRKLLQDDLALTPAIAR